MGRIVIITGAGSGLGLCLVRRFVSLGDEVFAVTRTKKNWSRVLASIEESKHFHLRCVDLTHERGAKKLISEVCRTGKRIDVLINCAGYGSGLQSVQDLTVKELQTNLEQNLVTAFLMCKYAIPVMRRQNGGLIANISSMAGKRAVPRAFAYSASKFGVVALSQCVAKENVDANIKCITVCPGGMNTPMRVKFFGKEDAAKQQSPDFVADITMQVIEGKIAVESGGDIVIRHGKITAINPSPAP